MLMDEDCIKQLRMFRTNVQRVLAAVRSGRLFLVLLPEASQPVHAPEWEDLDCLIRATAYRFLGKSKRTPYEHVVATAIEGAISGLAAFKRKKKLLNTAGMRHYLRYIRDKKTSGSYKHQDELLFFLRRLYRNMANQINNQQRSKRRKKPEE
jgi:hypothetical protein